MTWLARCLPVTALFTAALSCTNGSADDVVAPPVALSTSISEATWQLEPEPDFEFGADESGPLFHRLDQALWLSDGRIVVVDQGASRLHHFDPAGGYLESWGAPGFGPGEFRFISGVAESTGGTLVAFDYVTSRFTEFDAQGEVVRTIRVEPPEFDDVWIGSYRLEAMTPAGEAVMVPRMLPVFPNPPPGVEFSERPVLLFRDGHWRTVNDGVVWARELWSDGRVQLDLPFGSHSFATTGNGYVFSARGVDGTIRVVELGGEERRVIELDVERPRITSEVVDAYIEARVAEIPSASDRRSARGFWEGIPFPDSAPPFDGLVVAEDGSLWIRLLDPLTIGSPEGLQRWSVLDRDGRSVAVLDLPPSLEVVAIQDEFLLGIQTDSLGVQTLRGHRVVQESE